MLGAGFKGSGPILLGGLRWAVEQGFDVINMSLSTTKRQFAGLLHELADTAYFRRTVLVASAHNMPVESYPWRFSSVISVGSHEEPEPDTFFYNPAPPVEFFARGVGVEIAWLGGGTILSTGNSFATPHMSGHLRAHPRQASGADTVPAQERALPDCQQRGRRPMSDDLRAAVAAGALGSEECVPGAAAVDRGGRAGDLRRPGLVGLPASTRSPTSSSSRPSPARAPRS